MRDRLAAVQVAVGNRRRGARDLAERSSGCPRRRHAPQPRALVNARRVVRAREPAGRCVVNAGRAAPRGARSRKSPSNRHRVRPACIAAYAAPVGQVRGRLRIDIDSACDQVVAFGSARVYRGPTWATSVQQRYVTLEPTPTNRHASRSCSNGASSITAPCATTSLRIDSSFSASNERAAAALSTTFLRTSGGTRSRL